MLSELLDQSIRDAIEQGLSEMVQQAQDEGITPDNGVILASNKVATLLGINVRVVFGAAEVGALREYPLCIVSYLNEHELVLVSKKEFYTSLSSKLMGK